MSDIETRVREQVEAGWDDELAFLRDLVRRPSRRGEEARVQLRVADELRGMGLEPELWEVDPSRIAGHRGFSPPEWSYAGRPNLTARLPGVGGGRSLLLNGHVDVVPETPLEQWRHDPWGAEVEGGRMYGRGAADMKSGVAAMIYAVRALRAAGVRTAGDVTLETVIEEECTGNGALASLERGRPTDAVIIPEPFNQTLLEAQVGVMWARIRVRGAGAHVLGADKAVNAILASLPLIDAIRAMEREANARRDRPAPFRDMDHPLNYNVGTLHAGDWPSSVPSECVLEVRLSAFPGDDLAEVRDGFRRGLLRAAAADPWLAAHPPDIAFFAFRAEGCVLERSEPIFGSLASAHRLVMGGEPEYYASTATTDARFFNLYGGTPATCYGPVGGALHAPDEWVDLASVRHVTLVLALAVLDWCGGALEEVT